MAFIKHSEPSGGGTVAFQLAGPGTRDHGVCTVSELDANITGLEDPITHISISRITAGPVELDMRLFPKARKADQYASFVLTGNNGNRWEITVREPHDAFITRMVLKGCAIAKLSHILCDSIEELVIENCGPLDSSIWLPDLGDITIRDQTGLPTGMKASSERLSSLTAQNLGLRELPGTIRELKRLATLDVSGNLLDNLPTACSGVPYILAQRNRFRQLPEWLEGITPGAYVNLLGNPASEGSETIINLDSDTPSSGMILDLAYNDIRSVPPWVAARHFCGIVDPEILPYGSIPQKLSRAAKISFPS